jgi:hypothetical protein
MGERVAKLEAFRDMLENATIPGINIAVKSEIPAHYTKRIRESEETTMLRIEKLIDDRLKARFGWITTLWMGVVQAVLVIGAIKVLGL